MSEERYRELPKMMYYGASVGHVGARDIFFLRTVRIKWDDLEAAIVVKEEVESGPIQHPSKNR